jgi:LmbE family N-acetylglucosaminyl deacetylase
VKKVRFPESALVLVAHPDDEVIFFGGLILGLVAKGCRISVACAVSRFNPPGLTSIRTAEFRRACWRMGIYGQLLGLFDATDHLQLDELIARFQIIAGSHRDDTVYTHGIWGEYGHPHHRDVCLAAHIVFGDRVLSLAGPLPAVESIELTSEAFGHKRRIAAYAYHSQPFAFDWCSSVERFAYVTRSCAEQIVQIDFDERHTFPSTALSDSNIRDVVNRSMVAFRSSEIPFPEVERIPPDLWRPRYRRWLEVMESASRDFAIAANSK